MRGRDDEAERPEAPPAPGPAGPAAMTRDLTEGPIAGHMAALAIPAATGLVFSTLYNVVDVWFAGRIGTDAQAGLAVAGTVFFLLLALGFGTGAGTSALIGAALGAKDEARAREVAAQGLMFGAGAAAVVTALGWAFSGDLLTLLGADGAYAEAALGYLRVVLLAAPMFLMSYAANGVLSAQGDARSFRRALIGAFLANCALNPLFVQGLGMGLPGIGWATVAAQTGAAAWMLRRALASPVLAGAGIARFRPRAEPLGAVAGQALPASFNMLTITLGAFLIQFWLQRFGPDAVAGYGVALRIEQIVLLPGFGLTAALLPLTAQNDGARHGDRVAEAVRLSLLLGCGGMVAAALLLTLGGRWALGLFAEDPAVIDLGWSYLSYARWMLPAYFALFAATAFLQGVRRPLWPVWVGIYRQILALAGFGWLYVEVLDLGVEGVWWTVLSSVFSGLLLAGAAAARVGRPAFAVRP